MYWPCASVVTVRTRSISAGLLASTVTPGITAPLVSLTTPAMPLAWANAVAGSTTAHIHANTTPLASLRIAPPGCRLPTGNRDTRTNKRAVGRVIDKESGSKIRRPHPKVKHLRRYTASIPRNAVATSKMVKWSVAILGVLMLASSAVHSRPARGLADQPVTFTRDIAPIVYSQCAPCHQPDGPAPFSLITYDDVRRRATQIADADGEPHTCRPGNRSTGAGDFAGERRLSDAQIQTIAQWVAARASRRRDGSDSTAAAAPECRLAARRSRSRRHASRVHAARRWRRCLPQLRRHRPRVPGRATSAGIEFRPGGRGVHHANIRVDPTPASRRLDEADPEPGYEGMILHSADYPDGHFLGWTPGQAPPLAPNDLAWRLDAGERSRRAAPSAADRQAGAHPAVDRAVLRRPAARRATPAIVRLGRQDLDIPAGARDYRVTDSVRPSGGRRDPRHSAARALPRAQRHGMGRRFPTARGVR